MFLHSLRRSRINVNALHPHNGSRIQTVTHASTRAHSLSRERSRIHVSSLTPTQTLRSCKLFAFMRTLSDPHKRTRVKVNTLHIHALKFHTHLSNHSHPHSHTRVQTVALTSTVGLAFTRSLSRPHSRSHTRTRVTFVHHKCMFSKE